MKDRTVIESLALGLELFLLRLLVLGRRVAALRLGLALLRGRPRLLLVQAAAVLKVRDESSVAALASLKSASRSPRIVPPSHVPGHDHINATVELILDARAVRAVVHENSKRSVRAALKLVAPLREERHRRNDERRARRAGLERARGLGHERASVAKAGLPLRRLGLACRRGDVHGLVGRGGQPVVRVGRAGRG